jgi:hypothetical protein
MPSPSDRQARSSSAGGPGNQSRATGRRPAGTSQRTRHTQNGTHCTQCALQAQAKALYLISHVSHHSGGRRAARGAVDDVVRLAAVLAQVPARRGAAAAGQGRSAEPSGAWRLAPAASQRLWCAGKPAAGHGEARPQATQAADAGSTAASSPAAAEPSSPAAAGPGSGRPGSSRARQAPEPGSSSPPGDRLPHDLLLLLAGRLVLVHQQHGHLAPVLPAQHRGGGQRLRQQRRQRMLAPRRRGEPAPAAQAGVPASASGCAGLGAHTRTAKRERRVQGRGAHLLGAARQVGVGVHDGYEQVLIAQLVLILRTRAAGCS